MKTLTTASLIVLHLDQVISVFNNEDGVKTIGDFVKQVEFLADRDFPKVNEDEDCDNPANKFKGDMLEILAEIFFIVFSADPTVGLIDYHSVPLDEDYGVDGIGTNVNGDLCVGQMKYKSNPLDKVDYKEISRTYTAGIEVHNIPLYLPKNDTIFVFTTGNELTAPLQKVLKNKVRLIDRKIIAGKIDNNLNFWLQAEELIMNTLDYLNR